MHDLSIHLEIAQKLERATNQDDHQTARLAAALKLIHSRFSLDGCFLLSRDSQPYAIQMESSTAEKLSPFKGTEFATDVGGIVAEAARTRVLAWQRLSRLRYPGDRLWELIWQSMHLGPYAGPLMIAVTTLKAADGETEGMLIMIGREGKVPSWSAEMEASVLLISYQFSMALAVRDATDRAHEAHEQQRSKLFNALLQGGQPVMMHAVFAPLQTLELQVELAKMAVRAGDSRPIQGYLDTIRAMGIEVTKVVRNFLLLSKSIRSTGAVDSRRPQAHADWVNVRDALDDMVVGFAALADLSKISVVRRLEAPFLFPMRRGDFDDIVSNLLHNAFKYSVPGSKIKITFHHSKTHSMLDITSYGIPIRRSDWDRIFELGYRTPEAITAHFNAVGIGLYEARRLAVASAAELFITASDPADSNMVANNANRTSAGSVDKVYRNNFRLQSKL